MTGGPGSGVGGVVAPPSPELAGAASDAVPEQTQTGSPPPDAPQVTGGAAASAVRLGTLAGLPVLAAAVTVGGIFRGIAPRVVAAAAGVMGVALAAGVRRIRSALAANAVAAAGVFVAAILVVLPTGPANVRDLATKVSEAAASGDVLRPPAVLTIGWRAILAWLMTGVGFASGWAVLALRRPALGIVLALPVMGFAAISVPSAQQVGTGIAVFVLLAATMSLFSSIRAGASSDGGSVAYELRRTGKAVVLLALLTAALAALSTTNLLFPKPLINPTLEPQKPRAVPLSEVRDRVLFRVESSVTGPWRMGLLDVYDGLDWRLPAFAESDLREIPASGVIDTRLQPGVKATFTIGDIGGASLPGLPNLVGILGRGDLAYDARTGTIRVTQGTVLPGMTYTVTAAKVPTVEELRRLVEPPSVEIERFLDIPPAPPAVQDLLRRAPQGAAWDRLDFVRRKLLDTVIATGPGAPVSVTTQRVQEMLAGDHQASPFEIVAAQAMLARWVGVPARIGFGFDGGDRVAEGVYEVRPRHGATFLEVHFPRFGWLPVLGAPKRAKSTTAEGEQQLNVDVIPSEEIAIVLYLPKASPPQSVLVTNVRRGVLVVASALLLALLVYVASPLPRKAFRRARLRSWAARTGPAERIAVAYAEWRNQMTDFGYAHPSDTPLMFIHRVSEDQEHEMFAWLVTRTLWGDLRHEVADADALNAEELSRSLRRRLSQAHPWTLRVVAALSRLSLREPYDVRAAEGLGSEAIATGGGRDQLDVA